MSEKEKSAIPAFEKVGIRGVVDISEAEQERFRKTVDALLEHDLRLRTKIQPLLRTERTFGHSLSAIYDFFQDQHVCRQCKDGLSSCPKKTAGFLLRPYYDETRDEIRVERQACPYQETLEKALRQIDPHYVEGRDLYQKAVRTLRAVGKNAGMKNLEWAYERALESIGRLLRGQSAQGYAFRAVNDRTLSEGLFALTCYILASKDVACAYLTFDILPLLGSNDFYKKNVGLSDIEKAKKAKALFFEDIDKVPRLYSREAREGLCDLILSRDEEHLLFATTTVEDFLGPWRSALYGTEKRNAVLNALSKAAKVIVLQDL